MLPRQPEAVSLSNHRIARHTPAKPLSNRVAVSPATQRRFSSSVRGSSHSVPMPSS